MHAGLTGIEDHILMMDEAGIDVSILTSGQGMYGELKGAMAANEVLSKVVAKYADRFRFLAHAAPLDGNEALKEVSRWFDYCPGVVVPSSFGKVGLDDPKLEEFYNLLEDNRKYLFVHPALAPSEAEASTYDSFDLYRTVGREFSLVMAVIRLVCGGVLDKHSKLQIVVSHLGGGLSALIPRISKYQDKEMWGIADDSVHGRTSKHPFDHYLGRLYFDTAGFFGDKNAVRNALIEIPKERIVPGTDFPQEIRVAGPAKELIEELKRIGIAHNGCELIK
jgi:predicted TIM-barrel fold metal-dependent hydrolase